MEYHHIKVEVKDAVQVITLNRPDVLNSFNLPMAREVQDALGVAGAALMKAAANKTQRRRMRELGAADGK